MSEDHERRISHLESTAETHKSEILRLRDGIHETREDMTRVTHPLSLQVAKLETEFLDFKQEVKQDFREVKASVAGLDGMSRDFHLMLNIAKAVAALLSIVAAAGALKYLGLA